MPSAAVIVAHPDDESLWCGGLMLQRPDWEWFVVTLCRGSDDGRAARFSAVLRYLGAKGAMADLDDGPAQEPLDLELVRRTVLERLPGHAYDLVVSHGPKGEYTRHRRHEECSAAVVSLWTEGKIEAKEMKLFAYEDQGAGSLPQACAEADELNALDNDTFARKYHIITNLYGFDKESWEARATPQTEGFYNSKTPSPLISLKPTPSPQGNDE